MPAPLPGPGADASGTLAPGPSPPRREDGSDPRRRLVAGVPAAVGKAVVGQGRPMTRLVIALRSPAGTSCSRGPGVARTLLNCGRWPPRFGSGDRHPTLDLMPEASPAPLRLPLAPDSPSGRSVFSCWPTRSTAPRQTQSAVGEAMEGVGSPSTASPGLPDPFMVIATQNPVNYRGPTAARAQLAVSLLKLVLPLPERAQRSGALPPHLRFDPRPALSRAAGPSTRVRELAQAQAQVSTVGVTPELFRGGSRARHPRQLPSVALGVSPRGARRSWPRLGLGLALAGPSSLPMTSRHWRFRLCAIASSTRRAEMEASPLSRHRGRAANRTGPALGHRPPEARAEPIS